ncbi:signal transduction protein [Enterovibrio norvegicus FF-454]|uniref:Signal transduction protein n=1 Tax=Enterovibrio norvegicus FF-454 TaxID=1185651 RepID=A0A1E5CF24_9GAMM|nr:HDOD domain-containing protein [Enterovibrio norvegicus]OEE64110.1 signal transduction protein [Enterovibrio norvegicus FF-454]
MAEVFFSCQPIFDNELHHWGSELLFREGLENKFPSVDEDTATSRILSANFLSSANRNADIRYIVSFGESSLLNEIPLAMPSQHLIISVTDDCLPSQELVSKLRSYRSEGYRILMDSKAMDNEWRRHLELVDIFSISMERSNPADWEETITQFSQQVFLARKVETQEELAAAQGYGFALFQGYFFEKPQVVRTDDVAPSVMSLLDVCIIINRTPDDIDTLTKIISKDVSLLYKVIASANILAKTKKNKISNPRQAVVYLGVQSLRRLVSLLIMSNLNHQHAAQLQSVSLTRATFLSSLTLDSEQFNQDEGFIVGAFSMLDVMLSKPMADIIGLLDLSPDVKRALVARSGVYGHLLSLCHDIEHANWNGLLHWCNQLKLNDKAVLKEYEQARDSTSDITSSMQV